MQVLEKLLAELVHRIVDPLVVELLRDLPHVADEGQALGSVPERDERPSEPTHAGEAVDRAPLLQVRRPAGLADAALQGFSQTPHGTAALLELRQARPQEISEVLSVLAVPLAIGKEHRARARWRRGRRRQLDGCEAQRLGGRARRLRCAQKICNRLHRRPLARAHGGDSDEALRKGRPASRGLLTNLRSKSNYLLGTLGGWPRFRRCCHMPACPSLALQALRRLLQGPAQALRVIGLGLFGGR
mmetsp:Transcript_48590/g.139536  ORF Transcript_48590/g.139536 Transcript_48590/m.139536 type:complete len:244 (-) Transcript_48590:541-1272(-)